MNPLSFSQDGICRITLTGLPLPTQIEELIEEYVTKVELLPHPLRVIFLDISQLVHMQAKTRQVFSELMVEASKHYAGQVQLVIAGGPAMIRKFTELFCRAIGFVDKTHCFSTLDEGVAWITRYITSYPEAKTPSKPGEVRG